MCISEITSRLTILCTTLHNVFFLSFLCARGNLTTAFPSLDAVRISHTTLVFGLEVAARSGEVSAKLPFPLFKIIGSGVKAQHGWLQQVHHGAGDWGGGWRNHWRRQGWWGASISKRAGRRPMVGRAVGEYGSAAAPQASMWKETENWQKRRAWVG